MKNIIKEYTRFLPNWLRYILYRIYEYAQLLRILVHHPSLIPFMWYRPSPHSDKVRILIYHISGLGFGGTEKNLQLIAKYLDKSKFEICYMYSPQSRYSDIPLDGRKTYLANNGITFIPFTYSKVSPGFPYYIHDCTPSIFDVIRQHSIDVVISASAGYADYPLNCIRHIPIILCNIFGSITTQKNITMQYAVSHEVMRKVIPIIPKEHIRVVYFGPDSHFMMRKELGTSLRKKLAIPEDAIVFGRIGRPDDTIFDPIGIKAFEVIAREFPNAFYLIMAPPPALVTYVESHHIARVILLDPSPKEEDVWAFHHAIDVLAHFRLDGESFGLNIAESMLCGNPIITHKSDIWNAHLEYLELSFSRIANKDDVTGYIEAMKYMIEAHADPRRFEDMRNASRSTAERLFLPRSYMPSIEHDIDSAVSCR